MQGKLKQKGGQKNEYSSSSIAKRISCYDTCLRPDIFADQKEKIHKWAGLEKKIVSTGAALVFDEQPKINSTTKNLQRTMLSRPRQGYSQRIISSITLSSQKTLFSIRLTHKFPILGGGRF